MTGQSHCSLLSISRGDWLLLEQLLRRDPWETLSSISGEIIASGYMRTLQGLGMGCCLCQRSCPVPCLPLLLCATACHSPFSPAASSSEPEQHRRSCRGGWRQDGEGWDWDGAVCPGSTTKSLWLVPLSPAQPRCSTRMELLAWFLPRRKQIAVYISDNCVSFPLSN